LPKTKDDKGHGLHQSDDVFHKIANGTKREKRAAKTAEKVIPLEEDGNAEDLSEFNE